MAQENSGILATQQQAVQALNKLIQTLGTVFPQTGGTSSSATGGSATLPANPVGFISVTLPTGQAVKIAYYE